MKKEVPQEPVVAFLRLPHKKLASVFCKEDKTIKINVVGDMSETYSPEPSASTTEQMEHHEGKVEGCIQSGFSIL